VLSASKSRIGAHLDGCVVHCNDNQYKLLRFVHQWILQLDASLLHLREMLRGAGRGNRTPTPLLARDFESRASTNSAIPAMRCALSRNRP
jgi:hypothetical protein